MKMATTYTQYKQPSLEFLLRRIWATAHPGAYPARCRCCIALHCKNSGNNTITSSLPTAQTNRTTGAATSQEINYLQSTTGVISALYNSYLNTYIVSNQFKIYVPVPNPYDKT